jgi:uncharacterized protein (TIGR02246 family)
MMRKVLMIPIVAFAFAAGACQQRDAANDQAGGEAAMNAGADADTLTAVKAAEQGMLKAFQAKDAAALTSHYASDAVLALPGRTVKGSEAIGKANEEDFKDPAFKLSFTNERADASGDIAYTSGSFQVTYTDRQTKQVVNGTGTYVTVFKKQADGSWKAVADVATPTEG